MIHKYPYAERFDPECKWCQTMTLSSLGPEWCEALTGMSPGELREWAFAHGKLLGSHILQIPALVCYYDRAGAAR